MPGFQAPQGSAFQGRVASGFQAWGGQAEANVWGVDASLNVTWTRSFGDLQSLLHVENGRVYIHDLDVEGFACLSASTGETLWNLPDAAVPEPGLREANTGTTDVVIVEGRPDSGSSFGFYAYDVSDGSTVWSFTTGGEAMDFSAIDGTSIIMAGRGSFSGPFRHKLSDGSQEIDFAFPGDVTGFQLEGGDLFVSSDDNAGIVSGTPGADHARWESAADTEIWSRDRSSGNGCNQIFSDGTNVVTFNELNDIERLSRSDGSLQGSASADINLGFQAQSIRQASLVGSSGRVVVSGTEISDSTQYSLFAYDTADLTSPWDLTYDTGSGRSVAHFDEIAGGEIALVFDRNSNWDGATGEASVLTVDYSSGSVTGNMDLGPFTQNVAANGSSGFVVLGNNPTTDWSG